MNTDICQNKHQGNPESVVAFNRVQDSISAQRGIVLQLIKENPRTMKEIAQQLGVQLNTISGRGSELKKMGLVKPSGIRRDGSAVLVAA